MEIIKRPEYLPQQSEMKIYEEDIKIIDSYTHKQLSMYLITIEESKHQFNEGTYIDLLSDDVGDMTNKDLFATPFRLFSEEDPGGAYFQFSLVPYQEDIKENFEDILMEGRLCVRSGVGLYVKHDYDGTGVSDCLDFFQSYMQKRKLEIEFKMKPKLSAKDELALAVGETGLGTAPAKKEVRKI